MVGLNVLLIKYIFRIFNIFLGECMMDESAYAWMRECALET